MNDNPTVWRKWQCGGGSRFTTVQGAPFDEDLTGTLCNFSGCDCGTKVTNHGVTSDVHEASRWFHRPEKAKIVRYHRDHCSVVNPSVSPIKRLFQVVVPFGSIRDRNPKKECEDWLTANGYRLIGLQWFKF